MASHASCLGLNEHSGRLFLLDPVKAGMQRENRHEGRRHRWARWMFGAPGITSCGEEMPLVLRGSFWRTCSAAAGIIKVRSPLFIFSADKLPLRGSDWLIGFRRASDYTRQRHPDPNTRGDAMTPFTWRRPVAPIHAFCLNTAAAQSQEPSQDQDLSFCLRFFSSHFS